MTRTSHRRTIVVVQRAFAESSSWNGVVDLLLEDGFPVLVVPDGGTDVSAITDAAAVAGLIGEAVGAAASRSDGRVDPERVEVAA